MTALLVTMALAILGAFFFISIITARRRRVLINTAIDTVNNSAESTSELTERAASMARDIEKVLARVSSATPLVAPADRWSQSDRSVQIKQFGAVSSSKGRRDVMSDMLRVGFDQGQGWEGIIAAQSTKYYSADLKLLAAADSQVWTSNSPTEAARFRTSTIWTPTANSVEMHDDDQVGTDFEALVWRRLANM